MVALRSATSTGTTAAQAAPPQGEEVLDALPSGRPASIGAARDPLSIEEIGYAQALAEPAVADDATGADGSPGAEPLGVELTMYDPAVTARTVVVSAYDYTANQLVTVTVDLDAGTVVDTAASPGVQPPPSPAETDVAVGLLVASPEARPLQAEYLITTGRELDVADLIVTGGSYLATDGSPDDDACGTNRCVELQLQEPGGLYLTAVDFVVDLTAGAVIVLDHDTAAHGHGPDSDHGA